MAFRDKIGLLTNFNVLAGEDVLFLVKTNTECFRRCVVLQTTATEQCSGH